MMLSKSGYSRSLIRPQLKEIRRDQWYLAFLKLIL